MRLPSEGDFRISIFDFRLGDELNRGSFRPFGHREFLAGAPSRQDRLIENRKSKIENSWLLAALLFLLLACATPVFADKPDEAALQSLWASQQKDPGNHAAIAQDAAAFEQSFPTSPLVPVARGLAAWHLLESGDLDGARQLLEKMTAAGPDPIAAIGAEMARRWLTRLDREQVTAGLQKVYAEDLEYPETLAAVGALPQEFRPPLTDRWGAAWRYTPTAFKKLDIGDRQTFVLESTKLGEPSDLKTALALPYGAGFTFKPAKVMPPIGGKAVITFQDAAGRADTLSEGSAGNDLGFAYLGDDLLILSSGDYWSFQPRPSS
jgi:hypothetical protein